MAERIVPAVWLPAAPLETVGNEAFPPQTCPINPELATQLERRVPWVIESLPPQAADEKLSTSWLILPSKQHGRSQVTDLKQLSVDNPATLPSSQIRAIWQDEHGNHFSSRNYKGNDGRNVHVVTGASDPLGIRFNGLQTTYALERCMKASRLLLSHNIPTERIVGAYMPERMPFEGRLVVPEEARQTMYLEKFFEHASSDSQPEGVRLVRITKEELEAFEAALEESAFVVTAREMLSSDRLLDVRIQDTDTARTMLNRAMWLQQTLGNFQPSDDPAAGSLLEQYLGDFGGATVGTHVRDMHRLGLAHRMLHDGNITTTFELVDTDSIIGPAIGLTDRDQRVTVGDMQHDVSFYMQVGQGIPALAQSLQNKGLLPADNQVYRNFARALYKSYFEVDADTPYIGPGTLDKTEFLHILARVSSKELLTTRDEFLPISIFGTKLLRYTIDAMDDTHKPLPDDATVFDQVMAALDFQRKLYRSLTDWLESGSDSPLKDFWDMFQDLTTADDRHELAVQVRANIYTRRDPKEDTLLMKYGREVCAAYEQYIAAQLPVPTLGHDTERISGRDVAIVPATDMQAAIDELADSDLEISGVHIRQHIIGASEYDYHWDTDYEIKHAGLVYSSQDKADVTHMLHAVHSIEIMNLEETRRMNKNSGKDGQDAAEDFEVIGYAEAINLPPKESVQFPASDYLVYVTATDDGLKLEIESHQQLEAIQQLLQTTRFANLPQSQHTDEPQENVNSMQRFMDALHTKEVV